MHSGYVINLERRTDRIKAFSINNASIASIVDLEVVKAVDGSQLVFDEALRRRVNPWNFANLSGNRLRGVVGCALSHINLWKKIAASTDKFKLVFEDDAKFINPNYADYLLRVCNSFPDDADLVWLNDWDRSASTWLRRGRKLQYRMPKALNRLSFRRWHGKIEKTTEAYIISRRFAEVLFLALRDDIGAIDEHMRGYVARHPNCRCFYTSPALFTQADRSDTNIYEAVS